MIKAWNADISMNKEVAIEIFNSLYNAGTAFDIISLTMKQYGINADLEYHVAFVLDDGSTYRTWIYGSEYKKALRKYKLKRILK